MAQVFPTVSARDARFMDVPQMVTMRISTKPAFETRCTVPVPAQCTRGAAVGQSGTSSIARLGYADLVSTMVTTAAHEATIRGMSERRRSPAALSFCTRAALSLPTTDA